MKRYEMKAREGSWILFIWSIRVSFNLSYIHETRMKNILDTE